ncbi:hypothetical protein SPRG_16529 [Saprolegnia parasitica CBS 223.65]|uniref:Nucleotide-diphospho-sugar transferase domain-containing protein n=1 Tax=Saprolegnia parasitica (strain CBS 223.65) TaxID=695850 RepID=A0A067BHH2_SAPPC|nr:hypothetical protein SPRG_16529 [Saprolegnia parasitica CBS 223.65]KDO17834.1 hypothetical protein SPRG_16529 [Saprolegnia parasitica CBS 223.65]|eukprot:XP_012211458.1 hypothetical protein SPRG_16529 [Saprolegnia parasitica CBS 223.65]
MRSRGVVLTLCATSATGFVTCTRSTSLTEIFTNWCICQPCNLCSYKLFQGCDVLLTNAVSTSDGSDIPTRQPLLASSDWFLTADEITNARGGVPRTSLATSTSGNFMHIFADTSSTFAAIHHDLLTAHTAYFTSWTLGDIPYLPHIDPAITFKSTWGKAITTNGLSAHGLVWSNLPELDRVTDMHAWMNSLTPSHGARVQLMTDDRVTSITGSLHQKSLVLSIGNQVWAYAGGMDQAFDRWDTKYHNESALRNAAHIRTNNNGWIDVHSRVQGPAAVDILHNFLDRWNDPNPPGSALGPPFVTPPMPLQASWNVPQTFFSSAALLSSLAINTSAGPHDLQLPWVRVVCTARRDVDPRGPHQGHPEREKLHLH